MAWFPMIKYLKDLFFGKIPYGAKRSSAWPKVRAEYLKTHYVCECCGGSKGIEIHHKRPFYLFPTLELDKENLITLCEKRGCHLAMGHLYYYKSYNPNIETDIILWNKKVKERPK